MKYVALLLLVAFSFGFVQSVDAAEKARTFLAPRQPVIQNVVQTEVTAVQQVAVQKRVTVQREVTVVGVRPRLKRTVKVEVERTGRRWRIFRPLCFRCGTRSVSRSVKVEVTR